MKNIVRTVLFLCFLISTSYAQQGQVTIKVSDQKGGIPYASIRVSSINDTTRYQTYTADSSGVSSFRLDPGLYRILASSVSYLQVSRDVSIKSSSNTFNLLLKPSSYALKEIVVTAAKPLMRQEDDKTIVDPENLASSSTSAYEIIEKTPGLFVDQDGNIYLSSTTPATIYINGREQKMSASDVASMLKSLPPNSIASIEILRTPSARYDASGGGGIVNVVLKKGIRLGLTGSITAAINQGKQGNQLIGFNINNTSGKVSSFLNMQYAHRGYSEVLQTDRKFALDSVLWQSSYTLYPTDNYYAGFGLSFPMGKRWDFSYDGRINYSDFGNSTDNISRVRSISTGEIFSDNRSEVLNNSRSFNLTQGIATKLKIDSAGSEWTSDISFNFSPGKSSQEYLNAFNGNGDIETDLKSVSAQTNLLRNLPGKWTAEAGLKTSFVSFKTDRDYFLGGTGTRRVDAARSGEYTYRENINAAYAQLSKSFGGFILKGGLRMENTDMRGHQVIPSDTSFSVNRTDFFPYVYLSRKLMSIAGYELRAYLVYRRTLTRPDYQLLNPSVRYVDQYLYETGNPSLRPQFTQNYEANISVQERPLFALGLNETKDIFTTVVYSAQNDKRVSYRTSDNLGTNKEVYFRLLGAIPPGGKYFFVAGAQYNHNLYNGVYEQKALEFAKGSWSVFTYHTLKLGGLTQVAVNGFMRFNGQLQFYELGNFGSLNLQLNRQLMKKKLTVGLSVNDIFETNNNTFALNQGSILASGERKGDTRRFGINLRYNFGLFKKEQSNPFNIESPDKVN